MDKYRHKYNKYKYKYLKLKKLKGGNNQKSFETYEGMIVPYHEEYIENIPDSLITYDPSKPSNKILVINNIEAFDLFTKYYAKDIFEKKIMYVRWDRVAKNFLGFYIDRSNKSLYLQRYDMHNYKDKDIFQSWWSREYHNVNVIVFDK